MRPNIILINCDDLGYGDLGCYGSRRNRTPVIDHMAANGMRLTSFYAASPTCSPSRGAMLTGCYPPRIGFDSFGKHSVLFPGDGLGLNPAETTIAALLREQGYRTKIVGKWHCGDQPEFLPTRHGFEEYYGIPYSNDMGRQAGRRPMPPLPLLKGERVIQEQPDQRALTERYVEQCASFIHEHRDEPFFLYLAHMHVHVPLYAPDRFVKQSQNGDYGACVECIDWAAGCILRQLETEGLSENTLVIFTSDNGSRGDRGGSNGPLRGAKGSTWEGGQRVPCILYWPGHIQPGRACGDIISSIDFLPTIAGLCGTEPTPGRAIDGMDFGPLLSDVGAHAPRDTFFFYFMNNLEAVRRGDWKLHLCKKNESWVSEPVELLYNLKEDIGEQNNLYAQNPDIVRNLKSLAQQCREDLGDAASGIEGRGVRPAGRAHNPKPLTAYDENHPYICAEYDKPDAG